MQQKKKLHMFGTQQEAKSRISSSHIKGGRVSDKFLTDHCGILNHLLLGDVVLAERGFDISESVWMMQARVHIPSFTKGWINLQLTTDF